MITQIVPLMRHKQKFLSASAQIILLILYVEKINGTAAYIFVGSIAGLRSLKKLTSALKLSGFVDVSEVQNITHS